MSKVLVGMSGGVDSSAAALLLLRAGYQVAGATFRLWEVGTESDAGVEDARQVCRQLGIAHLVLDFREEFRQRVVDDFAAAYGEGRTPNPCVVCNREIKFGAFLREALRLGYDAVATGHYASVEYDGERGRYRLRRGAHREKDQSYFLYTLGQEQLSHVLMPLGDYCKGDVREITRGAGLAVSEKRESQDICFVPDGDYGGFLGGYSGGAAVPGDFVDGDGGVLGQHRGIRHYTIGQRKGLGIALGAPAYVVALDPERNTVTLGSDGELFRRELTVEGLRLIDVDALPEALSCDVRIRYRAKPAPATVFPLGEDRARVVFLEPQRAITPGQAAVFYQGDYTVGGGVIERY